MDSMGKCIICGGDAGCGISILGRFICSECEESMVNTVIWCDMYDEYKNLIKEKLLGDIKV